MFKAVLSVRFNILLTLLVVLSAFSSRFMEDKWTLVNEKSGIKVFTKKIPGKKIKALKMNGEIEGQSLSSFVALFQDLASYDKWVYSSADTKLLKRLSEKEIYYYVRSKFPWPFSDRDFVIRNKVWQDPESLTFHSHSYVLNNYLDEKDDVVRVKDFEGTWEITHLTNGNFYLNYTFVSDPGGNIPTWIINSFIDVGPFKTIKGMEEAANHHKYLNMKFSYIQELKID